MSNGGIILEMISVGNVIKVTAIDPVTKLEASVSVPQGTERSDMEQLAVRKLDYVIEKHRAKKTESEGGTLA